MSDNNPLERKIEDLADVSKIALTNAIERGEFNTAEILTIAMQRKAIQQAMVVPLHKKIIGILRECQQVFNALSIEEKTVDNESEGNK